MNSLEKKPIKGYEGLYSITSNGRVWSHPKKSHSNLGMWLKILITMYGYNRVALYKNGIRRWFFVHRLVAINYINNPKNYLITNHKDGNKLNNNINNLEWCTYKHNNNHATKIGLNKNKGQYHSQAQLTDIQVVKIKKMLKKKKYLQKEIAEIFNVKRYVIGFINTGKTWNHILIGDKNEV